jgi:hypothetical protein
MDDRSPFPYQGPLAPDRVTGREALTVDLSQRLTDRRVTALLGPRRFGKTSVLRRVATDLAEVGPETVWVDLYELSSMADLAAAVDRGLADSPAATARLLHDVAGSLSVRLGVLAMELSRGRRDRPDPVLALRSLLRILVRTAQRRDLILILDEFSGIAGVKGGAGLLRTELQHHYQDLGIVFAGSQPSTMRTLFGDRTQPFFAQADLVEIGPLSDAAMRDIVESGFATTGRSPANLTDSLIALADGHPQRSMQLADALWRHTPEGHVADETTWAQALAEVRATVDGGCERLYAMLNAGQQRTLRVVAGGGSIYGTAADALDLAPGTAQAATDTLLGDGDLARCDGRLVVVDPLLADWLRRRFPR